MISKTAAKALRDIYLGEYVTIFLRDMNIITVDEDGREIKVSAMRQGLVLDVCECFFYLGIPDGMVTATVSHDLAQMVEIEFQGSEFLDNDMPSREEDIH